jgi:hypothetical protein
VRSTKTGTSLPAKMRSTIVPRLPRRVEPCVPPRLPNRLSTLNT